MFRRTPRRTSSCSSTSQPFRPIRWWGPVGGGSSADVYEATGPGGELCAIKVLRHDMRDSQEAAARLLQEGRLLATWGRAS